MEMNVSEILRAQEISSTKVSSGSLMSIFVEKLT